MNYLTTSSGSTASRCGVAVCAFVMLLGSLSCLASDIRVGVLKFGTVNWELDTLKHHRLDTARGIVVKVLPISGRRFAGSTHSAHSCGTNSRSPALHAASQSVGAWQERPAS